MAEGDDSSQEKTEEPTARRLEKAREDGNVPKSKELNMALVMIAGVLAVLVFSNHIAKHMEAVALLGFSIQREELFDGSYMLSKIGAAAYHAAIALAPIFVVLLFSAMIGSLILGGWIWSTKAIQPKLSNMSIIKGLGRMFSLNSLIELVKAFGKVSVVAITALVALYIVESDLLLLYRADLNAAIGDSIELLSWATIALACSLLLIAAIDVPYQLYDYKKKLKMTKQEIKDEYKDSEGKPEVKQRIRQLQMEMAQSRMMSSVPEADVVITNPTHFAVALKYEVDGSTAPLMVAKGVDHVAFRIREVAEANGVDIIESPALARAIYHTTDIDREIASQLYMAVAQVLAYVFQLRDYRRGKGRRPRPLKEVPVPDDMQY